MQQLITELNAASDAYYDGKAELMSDYEWDAKFDQLKRLEEETGEILPNSPTQKVSEDHIIGQKEEVPGSVPCKDEITDRPCQMG